MENNNNAPKTPKPTTQVGNPQHDVGGQMAPKPMVAPKGNPNHDTTGGQFAPKTPKVSTPKAPKEVDSFKTTKSILNQMGLSDNDLEPADQSPMFKAKNAAIEAGKKGGYDDYSDFDEKGELMARPARTASLLGDTSKFHPNAQVRGIKKFNDGHIEYQLKNPEDKDFSNWTYSEKTGHENKDTLDSIAKQNEQMKKEGRWKADWTEDQWIDNAVNEIRDMYGDEKGTPTAKNAKDFEDHLRFMGANEDKIPNIMNRFKERYPDSDNPFDKNMNRKGYDKRMKVSQQDIDNFVKNKNYSSSPYQKDFIDIYKQEDSEYGNTPVGMYDTKNGFLYYPSDRPEYLEGLNNTELAKSNKPKISDANLGTAFADGKISGQEFYKRANEVVKENNRKMQLMTSQVPYNGLDAKSKQEYDRLQSINDNLNDIIDTYDLDNKYANVLNQMRLNENDLAPEDKNGEQIKSDVNYLKNHELESTKDLAPWDKPDEPNPEHDAKVDNALQSENKVLNQMGLGEEADIMEALGEQRDYFDDNATIGEVVRKIANDVGSTPEKVMNVLQEEAKSFGMNIDENTNYKDWWQKEEEIENGNSKNEKFAPNDYSTDFTQQEIDDFLKTIDNKTDSFPQGNPKRKKKVFVNKEERDAFVKSLPESAEARMDEFDHTWTDQNGNPDRWLTYWEVYYDEPNNEQNNSLNQTGLDKEDLTPENVKKNNNFKFLEVGKDRKYNDVSAFSKLNYENKMINLEEEAKKGNSYSVEEGDKVYRTDANGEKKFIGYLHEKYDGKHDDYGITLNENGTPYVSFPRVKDWYDRDGINSTEYTFSLPMGYVVEHLIGDYMTDEDWKKYESEKPLSEETAYELLDKYYEQAINDYSNQGNNRYGRKRDWLDDQEQEVSEDENMGTYLKKFYR